MAFMQIGSTNPKFSFILKKNPSSGMLVRLLREGHLFGYYSNEDKIFNCYFRDSDSEISYKRFKDEEFEYINPSRYNAPEFVLDSISEFLEHIIKKENEFDIEGYDNFLMINMINIKRKYLDIFQRYFKNISICSEEICANNFRLKFTTRGTLKELLSFVQLFAFFNILKNRYLAEDEIAKYTKQLIKAKAPYFIKYIFKISALKDRKNFYKYKKSLEENSFGNEVIEFKYGYAYDQRIDIVESLLDFKRSIIDFGCGEGNFANRFYSRFEKTNKKYYAIDKDEEKLKIVKKRIKDAENVNVGTAFPDLNGEYVDVIISEVVEHMHKEEATNLVKDMLQKDIVKNLIITTPNKDFNQYFNFDSEEMRCEDHQFEMGKEEFMNWIGEVVKDRKNELSVQFLDIGDRVNSVPLTLGVIIRDKRQ